MAGSLRGEIDIRVPVARVEASTPVRRSTRPMIARNGLSETFTQRESAMCSCLRVQHVLSGTMSRCKGQTVTRGPS